MKFKEKLKKKKNKRKKIKQRTKLGKKKIFFIEISIKYLWYMEKLYIYNLLL